MPSTKSLLVNIALLGVTCLVLFLLLEFVIWAVQPQLTIARAEQLSPPVFTESNYTPWKLLPYAETQHRSGTGREFDVHVSINAEGLRDDPISRPLDPDQTRIAVMGDSFTFGFGVELEETYHQVLESLIDDQNVRVLNFGRVDGAISTDTQYLFVKERIHEYDLDTVVLGYYVGNDFIDYGKKTKWDEIDDKGFPTKIGTDFFYIDDEDRLRAIYWKPKQNQGLLYNFNRFMSTWSHSYVLLKNTFLNANSVPPPIHADPLSSELASKLVLSLQLLNETKAILDAQDINFVVMLIPTRFQSNELLWTSYSNKVQDADANTPQKEILAYCTLINLTCIDARDILTDRPDAYFPIDGHWNVLGHRLAGEHLYSELSAQGII